MNDELTGKGGAAPRHSLANLMKGILKFGLRFLDVPIENKPNVSNGCVLHSASCGKQVFLNICSINLI
jgi:hypothetical protein